MTSLTAYWAIALLPARSHPPQVNPPAVATIELARVRSLQPASVSHTDAVATPSTSARTPTRMLQPVVEPPHVLPEIVEDYLVTESDTGFHDGRLFGQAIAQLEQDPDVLRALLDRLDAERTRGPDEEAVHRRAQLALAAAGGEQVFEHAKKLLAERDPRARSDGFELMRMNASKQALELVIDGLTSEQEPAVLASALGALQAHDAIPPNNVDRLTSRLEGLAGHADSAVREASLGALGHMARSDQVASTLARGLSDESSAVVSAALDAIASSRLKTSALKTELMRFALDARQDEQMRSFAARLLQGFPLGQAEFESLQQLR